jgi:hypothetical protein
MALRAEQPRSARSFVVWGDTIAIVRLTAAGARRTVAAVSAEAIVEEFRGVLEKETWPAVSAIVQLPLPPPDEQGSDLDVLLFRDLNADGQWNAGETYVTAWHGGQGSYRVIYFSNPADLPVGAGRGWNIKEGGEPPTYHPDLEHTVLYLNPIVAAEVEN